MAMKAYSQDIVMLLLYCYIFANHATASAKCPWDEYRVGIECCPACPAGMHVLRDCTANTMTKCKSCEEGTFKGGLNEQKQCSNCTKCDAGLKEKKPCTNTSDALCEILDGYFCNDSSSGGCRAARRHMVCSPGQYISQRGTADKDTACLQCTDGTFSNGTSCQNHTKCEAEGLGQIKPGSDSTDSECGEHGRSYRGLVVGIPVVLVAVVVVTVVILIIKRRGKQGSVSRSDKSSVVTVEEDEDQVDTPLHSV